MFILKYVYILRITDYDFKLQYFDPVFIYKKNIFFKKDFDSKKAQLTIDIALFPSDD